MNILVYYPAASTGGSITILENFYNEVSQYFDKSIQWYFVISNNSLKAKDNIHIISLPWVKKSYLHRVYCDDFYAPILSKKLNIDIVYSMQNMPIKHTKAKQIVYLHQSLQYCKKNFSLLKKDERPLAFRQKIILQVNKYSLKKSNIVIVQTKWMKEETIKWLKFSKDKIKIVHPIINISNFSDDYYHLINNQFFYPATSEIYKNHKIIFEASNRLIKEGISNFEIILTLKNNELPFEEYKECLNNVKFVGYLDKKSLYNYYKHSVLIFPSYLETFGLPLEEARKMKSIILASNTTFSHEILDDYENVHFFNNDDSYQLYNLMKSVINKKIEYKFVKDKKIRKQKSIIDYIVRDD